MNLCRTCKWWAAYAGAIGYGNCCNVELQLLVNMGTGPIKTCQNFGCVCHEPLLFDSDNMSIHSTKDRENELKGFLSDKFPHLLITSIIPTCPTNQ